MLTTVALAIEAQLAALTSYIKSQPGWILVLKFSDDASGATTDRPDLQRALRAAKAGRYDVLLVYRVDRFSRRLSDLLDLLHELDDAAVAFCSATEPFDTSTPSAGCSSNYWACSPSSNARPSSTG